MKSLNCSIIRFSNLSLIIFLLNSCANSLTLQPSEPDFKAQPQVWSSYLNTTALLETPVESRWWSSFNDPALTQLIEKAVLTNDDIKLARERITQARAVTAFNLSAFNPSLSARGSVSDQNQSETSVLPVGRIPDFEPDNTIYSGGFDASWEIDLFGRQNAIADLGELRVQSARESLRDVLIGITAELAQSYFDLLAAQVEEATIQSNIAQQKQLVDLTRLKKEYGEASDLDVERAVIILKNYETYLPEIDGRIRNNEIRISILTGGVPSDVIVSSDKKNALPVGPAAISLGLTSEVLRRRPDVRIAERNYAIAAREVDLSKISTYPRFSLFGSAGPETTDLSDFLDGSSIASNLGALINWSLYDGGRQKREQNINQSKLRQAELSYSHSVTKALEDVEIAATNYISANQTSIKRAALIESNEKLTVIANDRYVGGTGTLLDVIIAERDLGDAAINFVKADAMRVISLISLYKALGGGWETLEPLSSTELTRR